MKILELRRTGAGLTGSSGVPVGRRLLFAERRRAALTVLGVAAALLLVLVLGGIFAGAIDRVTSYIRSSQASVFISQSGVRTMHMSASTLRPATVAAVESVHGVAWVAPIGFTSGSVSGPGGRELSYVIGYDTGTGTGHGGPAELVRGRGPGQGEVVLDEQAADELGVAVGGTASVLGTPLRVVGLSSGGTSITNTTAFVSQAEYSRLHGPEIAYILVGADDRVAAATVAGRIRAVVPSVTVQTREEFASSEAKVVTDMSADLLRLMSSIGLLIALAVIALGLMTATLNRIRDFAVLKALGSRTSRLLGAVALQVIWTVGLAALVAALLAQVLAWSLPLVAPAVQISVTPTAVARTTLGALAVGMVAALWPLRRIAAIDAATAFRETR